MMRVGLILCQSVNNALLAANLLMGSEAMVTLAKAGVDVEAALNAIDTSSGRTFVLQGRFPKNILTRRSSRFSTTSYLVVL